MRQLVVLFLAGLVISSCRCGREPSALSITVELQGSAARCVIAGVRLEGNMVVHATVKAVAVEQRSTLIFGVARTEEIKGRVIPFARGYKAADCAAVVLDAFDESTNGEALELDAPGVHAVTLALRGNQGADGGSDGGPGCVVLDCADLACDSRPCSGGGTCGTTRDGGHACRVPGPESLCSDLMDNDDDGQADCADSDCAGQTCSDQNACTTTDTCLGTVCDSGNGRVSCPPHSGIDCFSAVGQCVPATGLCDYPALDGGASCEDGMSCTHTDVCGPGGCTGTAYFCNATTCASSATCNGLGGCTFIFASSSTGCDDGTSCTYADRCGDAGICKGTGYACTPPPCFSGTACNGDGGCLFAFNGPGGSCPGGTCGPDAGCLRGRDFPYRTSNFIPDDVPDASIAPATVIAGCTIEFSTTTNVSLDGGWCGQISPTPFVFTQDGGISTTVLPMAGFDLGATSSLIISGTRPIILAVYGSAAIHGVIDARSLDVARVGPGGNWSGCGLMNGGNATGSSGGGGAGFGTAGARGGGSGAGDAGQARINAVLEPLTGGCLGGRGHDSSNRFEAPGGPGGGAVQISASGLLTVDGTISTSGAGGRGSTNVTVDENGGGGGGSGGAILLEGLQLAIASGAKLTCNGGAGGGGREDPQPGGFPGQSGSLADSTPALGGRGGSAPAGDGGHGAAGTTPATVGTPGAGIFGSGGGGAGLGIIRLNGVAGCTISDAGVLVSGVISKSALCP